MTTHKTFGGMVRASKRLTAELRSVKIDNDRDRCAYKGKFDNLLAELRALWSNPEDQRTAEETARDLVEAWHHANH